MQHILLKPQFMIAWNVSHPQHDPGGHAVPGFYPPVQERDWNASVHRYFYLTGYFNFSAACEQYGGSNKLFTGRYFRNAA